MKKDIINKNSLLFKDENAYVKISKIEFQKNDSWTIHIILKEFLNNKEYNYFLTNSKFSSRFRDYFLSTLLIHYIIASVSRQ